ncbi:MAG: citryl-CoA lyase [Chloroflexi bacterium]|nr:citryl-CoA lyase [Chloroflexota bacterium]
MSDEQRGRAYWRTAVGEVTSAGEFLVRGYPIEELIGNLTYTEVLFLALKGRLPSEIETRMLDGALCSIVEYPIGPAPYAARVVVSANPSINAGLAAGILAQGVYAVSPQHSGEFIQDARRRMAAGLTREQTAREVAAELVARKERLPGAGHPTAGHEDPRARRLRELAQVLGFWAEHAQLYEAILAELNRATGRALVMNVDGALAAVLSDMGFHPLEMAAIAALSMMPGVIAHTVEEIQSGVRIRQIEGLAYTGPPRRHLPGDRVRPPD